MSNWERYCCLGLIWSDTAVTLSCVSFSGQIWESYRILETTVKQLKAELSHMEK